MYRRRFLQIFLVVCALLLLGIIGWIKFYGSAFPNFFSELSSTVRSAPIPLDQLPPVPHLLTQEYNVWSQVAGQLAAVWFSSDPTAAQVRSEDAPQLIAFLYNSTPCVQAGQSTNYRLAIRGASNQPASNVTVHLVAPANLQLSDISPRPDKTDSNSLSYFWVLTQPLVSDELFVINVGGTFTNNEASEAQLIVTYTGLDDEDIRHVVSTHPLAACEGV